MYKTINKTFKYKLIIAQMPVIFGDACNYYYKYKDRFFACDYLLTHSKHSKKFLSKVIQTEFLNVGSFKLNSYLSDLPKQGDTGICFISQFRGNKGISSLANPTLAKPLRHAYNLVSKVCQDHNILLSIALVSTRKDKSLNIDDEIKFYNKIYNKYHYANESSYNFAIKSNTIVCMNSTLGLELVSLGYKVLFLDTLMSMIKMNTSTKESLPDSRYNTPEKPVRFSNYYSHYYGDDGEFWDEGIDYDSVNEKIINLYEMDSDEWKNIYTKYTLPVQYHDPNNKILRSIIENKLGIV